MKLGIGSYTFGWRVEAGMTPFELLEEAAAFGVSVVQIADNLPLDALSPAELRRVGRTAQVQDVTLEMGTRGIDPDHLLRYVEIAESLSSSLLRVVVDTKRAHPEPPAIAARLRKMVPDLEASGVTLAVENHDRLPAVALRRIMEEVDSPRVGICLDTANSIGANEGVAHVLATLAPWIANLHVKDITIRRLSHLMGFLVEGAPAGKGDLDIPDLLNRVRRDVPRDVNAILELWTPPEEDETKTLAKERRWARTSIKFLRMLVSD